MKRAAMILTVVAALVAGGAWAQGVGPAVDTASAFTVSGPVVAFTATAGSGHPSLAIDDAARGVVTVGLGPLWYLQSQVFSAEAGDQAEALVYPCSQCSVDGAAARVTNLSTGAEIALRADDGTPLWVSAQRRHGQRQGSLQADGSRRGSGRGRGAGASGVGRAGGCPGPDVAAAVTTAGTVVSFSGGPGLGHPAMVFEAGGEQLTIVVSPYRALAAAGLDVAPGRELTVTYAPAPDGDLVALSVTDGATGATVVLRDAATGRPVGGRGGSGMGAGPRGAGGDCPYAS